MWWSMRRTDDSIAILLGIRSCRIAKETDPTASMQKKNLNKNEKDCFFSERVDQFVGLCSAERIEDLNPATVLLLYSDRINLRVDHSQLDTSQSGSANMHASHARLNCIIFHRGRRLLQSAAGQMHSSCMLRPGCICPVVHDPYTFVRHHGRVL